MRSPRATTKPKPRSRTQKAKEKTKKGPVVRRMQYSPSEAQACLTAYWSPEDRPSYRSHLKKHPSIPFTTFQRWVEAGVQYYHEVASSGAKTMLSAGDEEQLRQWLVKMSGHSLCVDLHLLLQRVETLNALSGGDVSTNKSGKPTYRWLDGFLARWVHTHTHTSTQPKARTGLPSGCQTTEE